MPVGKVHYCIGEPLVFTCSITHVSNPPSVESIQWRVRFENSLSMSDITPSYLTNDVVGYTHSMVSSDGNKFEFNLTENSAAQLVSTLTVTVTNDTASTINNATVNCGPEDFHQNAVILPNLKGINKLNILTIWNHCQLYICTDFC